MAPPGKKQPAEAATPTAKPPAKPAAKKPVAKKRAPKKTTPATPVRDQVEERLEATEKLLQVYKTKLAQSLAGNKPESVSKLQRINKLERELENKRTLLRLRKLTSEPGG